MDLYSKGASVAKLHPVVVDRLVAAKRWKKFPPSLDWIGKQPHGYVEEVMSALEAYERRQVGP